MPIIYSHHIKVFFTFHIPWYHIQRVIQRVVFKYYLHYLYPNSCEYADEKKRTFQKNEKKLQHKKDKPSDDEEKRDEFQKEFFLFEIDIPGCQGPHDASGSFNRCYN